MLTTNMHELMQIMECSHSNPHNILGMHELCGDKTIIRVFNPSAASIKVFFPEEPTKRYTMEKIHAVGFFVLQLKETPSHRYKLAYRPRRPNMGRMGPIFISAYIIRVGFIFIRARHPLSDL